mgnify:CR=1 FL=1
MDQQGINAQCARLEEGILRRVKEVLSEGQYILGRQVEELEQELARLVGRKHCIGVSSGTDALVLALLAEGIGPGDGVFTTPFTFYATAEAIQQVGAQPVFCDIHPETFHLDPHLLSLEIRSVSRTGRLRPRAVIAVDLYGACADYDRLESVCEERDLVLIEDAAQSMGASRGGRMAGSFGKYAATSFFPTKPLGGYGDGGAVFCDDDEADRKLRSLREHGRGEDRYTHLQAGRNARLDTIQAAILLEKLTVFSQEIEKRRAVAQQYSARLGGRVRVPDREICLTSAFSQYTITLKDRVQRDHLREELVRRGVEARVYYPLPLNRQPALASLPQHAMPNAEEAAGRVLSLPIHPYLSQQEVDRICEWVLEILDA